MRKLGLSLAFVTALCAGNAGAQNPDASPAPAVPQPVAPLDKQVTIDVQNMSLARVIESIDQQAGLGLAYSDQVLPKDKLVTLNVRNVTARQALAAALEGTGIVLRVSSGGALILVRATEGRRSDGGVESETGVVYGTVTDSASGEPVPNVLVSVKGTTLRARTSERGQYQLRDVPVGDRTIITRLLGYLPLEKEVTVADGRRVREDFALRHGLTRLQEVVTTATGPRRRLELGNDITILNADSIVATEPVFSVTELLANRVPGLMVQPTSGAPGDPSRLRLRGASSARLSNDPIVVVDGVRIYAEQSDRRNANLADPSGNTGFAAPSPLDYLDQNSIETIEVLKGPSAATLYGQDAANGVIVITTKKGQAGPPRWTTSVDRGTSYMPGSYPEAFIRWGHELLDNSVRFCPLSVGGCGADSLVRFQLLNDRDLSPLDRGERMATTLGVSGGSEALTYSVNGSFSEDIGIITLPDFEIERYRAGHGVNPPEWMRRPQSFTRWGATSRLVARLGSKADVSLSAMLSRNDQQRSSLEQQLPALMSTYLDRASGTYYRAQSLFSSNVVPVTRVIEDFYTRATAQATQFTNAVTLNWQALSWLTTSSNVGLNVIQRADQILLPRGAELTADSVGHVSEGRGTSLMGTMNVRATATIPVKWGFRSQISFGANYSGSKIDDLSARADNLTPGTESVGEGATILNLDSRREEAKTYGWYVEPSISHKRLWFSTGLRLDGGSTFGTRVKLPSFPKLDVSYLVSDEPFFPSPLKAVFNTLRLRVAYGHAGVQPGPGDRLRLYAPGSGWTDGVLAPVTTISTIGNTELKPERSTEFEGGFDADILDHRLAIGFSGYRKMRFDALMSVPLPPSVYGGGKMMRNIGTIRNTGMSLDLSARPLRTDRISVSTELQLSQNRNLVVKLGRGVEPFVVPATRVTVKEGYPLFGFWARPVLGYSDRNGDGIIASSELLYGDTAVYLGSAEPNYSATGRTTVSLLGGMLAVTAGVSYDDEFTQYGDGGMLRVFARANNDPATPLAEQALVMVRNPSSGNPEYASREMQTVSTLRFNSLAVTYNAPASVARRMARARALSLSLQGTNLGLRTDYRGKDPNVNGNSTGNGMIDNGVLPRPRTWQVRVNARY